MNFEALLGALAHGGVDFIVVGDLDMLIHVKRAAGRPKDLEAIAEIQAIRAERGS